MPGRVHCIHEGEIGWIVFDHPERRNAISSNMWDAPADAVGGLAREDATRVVILCGRGEEAFVSRPRRDSTDEAACMGLVNRVFDKTELQSSTLELARQIAANVRLTVRAVKLASQEPGREPAARDTAAIAASTRACFDTDGRAEGVSAFMEKRNPESRGR